VRQFERWVGRRVDYVGAFTGRADWSDWSGSIPWAIAFWKPLGRPMRWSIPLFPLQGNLKDASAGAYNHYYRAGATALANDYTASKQIVVRVGEEFNGDWMPWAAKGQTVEFVQAYRNFVDTFRSVSGRFVFEWNVNVGDFGINPADAYPGDTYVDIIGMDFYFDQWAPADPVEAWDHMVNQKYGLQWLEDYATAHHKPTAYSEWGVKQDDSGVYIQNAAEWFQSHNVAYQMYWNSNAAFPGMLSGGQYPMAGKVFIEAFRH
jgi:beta-mannanase